MKLILLLVLAMILSSCAFFSKKVNNSAAINKYENKMRSLASGSEGKLQLPPGYRIHKDDLTIVEPDDDVILFYKEGNEIIIKNCGKYSVINNRANCQSNSRLKRVAVSEFKKRLKLALRIQNFDTLGQQQEDKLKDYRGDLGQTSSARDLVIQDKARDQVEHIEKFIAAYGEKNANTEDLSVLRQRLTELETKVSEGQKFSAAVVALNTAIETLVDDVIGSSQMKKLSYSRDKIGIEYSILRTYVKPYLLAQVTFVPVAAGVFIMSSPSSENEHDTEEVCPRVIISKAFEISATEVTQLQWVTVMGSNPSHFKDESQCPESYMEINGVSLCSDHSMEKVSSNEIKGYLVEYNKRAKDNFEYRLPIKAELDIYGVHGNIWERVEDQHGDLSDSCSVSVIDPKGGRYDSSDGSWKNRIMHLLGSAIHTFGWPRYEGFYLSFRLVRTPK